MLSLCNLFSWKCVCLQCYMFRIYKQFDLFLSVISLLPLIVMFKLSLNMEWTFTLFVTEVTPWRVTLVITSFGVNIEWTERDSTRWVVNFHSTGVRTSLKFTPWRVKFLHSIDGVNYSLDIFREYVCNVTELQTHYIIASITNKRGNHRFKFQVCFYFHIIFQIQNHTIVTKT